MSASLRSSDAPPPPAAPPFRLVSAIFHVSKLIFDPFNHTVPLLNTRAFASLFVNKPNPL